MKTEEQVATACAEVMRRIEEESLNTEQLVALSSMLVALFWVAEMKDGEVLQRVLDNEPLYKEG